MNSTIITQTILMHLQTWEYFDNTKIAMPNRNFTPPVNEIWYRLTIQHGVNKMSGMASTPMTRELGAVVVELFAPENTGDKEIVKQADSLANYLKYYTKGRLELQVPSIVNVPFDTGTNRYKLNVRVPFRYN